VELVVDVPGRRPVGSGAPLQLTVRNRGNQILRNVSVVCEFPQGLRFPGSDRASVAHKIPRIDPGDVKESLLTLVGEVPGRHACRFTVNVGSQTVLTRTVSVEFVSRQLDWHIDGPEERTLGSRVEFNIPLINISRSDLRELTVRVELDAALTVREMTQGGRLADRSVTWTLDRLAANEGLLLQLEVECREVTKEACLKVSVAGKDVAEDSNEACLVVAPRTGWLNVRVEDLADPLPTGEETDVVVVVENQGVQPVKDVAVTCTWPEGFELVRAGVRQGDRLRPATAETRGRTATLTTIPRLAPNEALEYRVTLKAQQAGSHRLIVDVTNGSDQSPVRVVEPIMVHR
jgi:hypothetical protein